MKSRQKHRSCPGDAISVAISKEDDSVLAWYPPAGLPLKNPEENALDSFPVVGAFRPVLFRDKHVAIRKDVNPARVIEAAREGADCQAIRCHRRRISRPATCLDDVYDGNQ